MDWLKKNKGKFALSFLCVYAIINLSLIDVFIWRSEWNKPTDLKQWFDLVWLVSVPCVIFLFFHLGQYYYMKFWKKVLLMIGLLFGASVFWDLTYAIAHTGTRWYAKGAYYWFWIPDVIRISFNKTDMIYFGIFRACLLITATVWSFKLYENKK